MAENFSYTKIDTYHQCGFKYKLVYIDNHFFKMDSLATEFGTLIHATEESIGKAIQIQNPINYIDLKNNIIKTAYELQYKYKNEWSIPDKSDRTYQQKIYEYLESGIYRLEKFIQEHPSFEIVGLEQKFQINYKGNLFKGFIDRVFKDTQKNKYLIQDIKTYPQPVEKSKLKVPLQFVIYVLAAKELYGCSDNDILCQYDLPICNQTQDAGDFGFMEKGSRDLDLFFNNISSNKFEPNPTPLCHWCQFSKTNPNHPIEAENLCPYHSLWTRENKDTQGAVPWMGIENHALAIQQYIELYNKI